MLTSDWESNVSQSTASGKPEKIMRTIGMNNFMPEPAIILWLRKHYEHQFPKVCEHCQRRYATLRDYILNTTPLGSPYSFDASLGDWDTKHPIGGGASVNCACGNTLALTTSGMPVPEILLVWGFIRSEIQKRGVAVEVVLDELRDEARRQVLSRDAAST